MTVKEITNARDYVPFQPFRLVISDGANYEIRHPELLLIGKTFCHVGLVYGDEKIPDDNIRLSNDHITSIVPLRYGQPVKA